VPEPAPREHVVPYRPVTWPVGSRRALATRSLPLEVDMTSLLEQRQTRRDFSQPVSDVALGEFLWLTCRSRSSRPSPYGPDQESRPHPSAGAMHPIHVLVSMRADAWLRYDPTAHSLDEIPGSGPSAVSARMAASELVNIDRGTVVALVAEPGKSAAKYSNAQSLVWRDAGVVLGYMSVVAQALGLSFCPLGITGDAQLTEVPGWPAGLYGTGLGLLGA
jgi:SagB-type dehydrogenase family enzyme